MALPPKCIGFTIHELLAVVAIVAVLAAIAVPSLASSIDRTRLKSAAETIAGDLDLARMETAKRNANLQVSFRTGADWCYGIDTGPCDCGVPGNCAIKRVRASDVSRGVTMGTAAFSGNSSTTFNRLRGTAGAGTVTLRSDSADVLNVVVSTRGRVRVCSPWHRVAGYPPC